MTTVELSPYLVLILVGFLPNEIWRALGLVLARGLNEDSEIVVWSRAVATAILAAVIGKLILFPSGTLDNIPLAVRIAAAACGFVAFICIKRSVFAAVLVVEAMLLLGVAFRHPCLGRSQHRVPGSFPAFSSPKTCDLSPKGRYLIDNTKEFF